MLATMVLNKLDPPPDVPVPVPTAAAPCAIVEAVHNLEIVSALPENFLKSIITYQMIVHFVRIILHLLAVALFCDTQSCDAFSRWQLTCLIPTKENEWLYNSRRLHSSCSRVKAIDCGFRGCGTKSEYKDDCEFASPQ